MLAFAYLVVLVLAGDVLVRRWLPAGHRPLRLAGAFLVGLLVMTWATYLLAAVAGASEQPLVVSSAVVIGMIGPLLVLDLVLRWRGPASGPAPSSGPTGRRERWDWLFALAIAVFVTWMMATTLQFGGGELRIGIHESGDFGPNVAIAQGFALGHNFPTEYPLFAGEPILYHFLFYFQVGNMTFLGFNPALANNILSIGSMVSMLVVLVALGERLFRSVAVGRIGAILFFFHGSLSFIPYLASFPSPAAALEAIPKLSNYLGSGFPYRSEEWAIWSQNVFLNQRHLASAIGILLLVVLFVVGRLQVATTEVADADRDADTARARVVRALRDPFLASYALCGVLLGLLPLWNGAMYVAAAALLGAVFVLFPGRTQLLVLAAAAAVVSLPQVLFLRAEGTQGAQYPAFHWGYVVDPATPVNVATYLAFLFGPKLLLMAVAVASGTGFQRRFFQALSGLLAVAFLVQLSIDISQNHKLITTWLIVGNLFAAAGLLRLWRGAMGWRRLSIPRPPRRLVATALALVILVGGGIDLVPIANDPLQRRLLAGDRLFDWVRDETDRRSVFLTDIYIHHPILLAGRRIYLGWPAYPFSMGYDMATREASYRRLLSSKNPREVVRQLQAAGIDYVAFDDGLRDEDYVQDTNEALYRDHFETVFTDESDAYRHIAIYRVPTDPDAWRSMPGADPVEMSVGGLGTDAGRFDGPRGIGVGPDGSVLVADTRNHRIQRFTAGGSFLGEFGAPGAGPGQADEPHGVAADSRGHVFIADSLNDRVLEFDAEDAFVAEWRGPDPGFYGPRDVAVGADDTLFVLDQGRARVVRRAPDGTNTAFGSFGAGPGQLNDPTGIGVGGNVVAVADPTNGRIAVFDPGGRFVRSIPVAEWVDGGAGAGGFPDVAVSADGTSILASSPATSEVIVFSVAGERSGSLGPPESGSLEGPGAIAIGADGVVYVVNLPANRVSLIRP